LIKTKSVWYFLKTLGNYLLPPTKLYWNYLQSSLGSCFWDQPASLYIGVAGLDLSIGYFGNGGRDGSAQGNWATPTGAGVSFTNLELFPLLAGYSSNQAGRKNREGFGFTYVNVASEGEGYASQYHTGRAASHLEYDPIHDHAVP
jgi:hypothetical protein